MATTDVVLDLPPNAPPPPAGEDLLAIEARPSGREPALVDVVIPVYNEAAGLEASIRRLQRYLATRFPLPWTITIADNASTDRTWAIAVRLAWELDGVGAVHLDQKGRGRALRATWSRSPSPVVAYMDVDLSTDLDALLPLVAPLVSGHSDVAIGSRLAFGSQVARGPKREAISRVYNLLLKATLHNGFSDAQCGFKAVRADVACALLPLVEDEGWFFDTELLVLAERNGMRIHEVPVDWVDDADSRVHVLSTATGDLRGIARTLRRLARGEASLVGGPSPRRCSPASDSGGQVVRFASIGVVSTVLFSVLFALLIGPLGPLAADAVALGACAVVNVAANRRLTFALRGRAGRARHYLGGAALSFLPLCLTLLVLAVLGAAGVTSFPALLAGITAANAVGTATRFATMRRWTAGAHEGGRR